MHILSIKEQRYLSPIFAQRFWHTLDIVACKKQGWVSLFLYMWIVHRLSFVLLLRGPSHYVYAPKDCISFTYKVRFYKMWMEMAFNWTNRGMTLNLPFLSNKVCIKSATQIAYIFNFVTKFSNFAIALVAMM